MAGKDVVRVAAVTAVPAALAVGVLAGAGVMPWWAAALVAAVAGAAGFGFAWRHLRAVACLRAAIDGMVRDQDQDMLRQVAPDTPLGDLAAALRRLRRDWSQHEASARGRLDADELIIDSLPDPLVVVDAQARIVRANIAARALLGTAIKGRDLASALRHPQVLDAVQETLASGDGQEVEFVIPGAVDRSFNARTKIIPEPTPDGANVALTLHDLTELKRSDQMRADFVANASHELRTPLSALVGFIETLRGSAADDAAARERFLGIMQEQADRMARLIKDLLSLSRIELNEHSRPTTRADAVQIAHRAADSLELQAAARDMTVTVEGEATAWIIGDADQIEQVLQNLLDNAIKYGRAATAVRVVVRRLDRGPAPLGRSADSGGVIAISVANEGEGIPAEHLPRLTERFYRVDPARSRQLGGTGLGLAIVKHIVNRHRGAMTVESSLGRGATVTVHLPAASADTPAATTPATERGTHRRRA